VTFVAVFFNRGIGWMFTALLVLNIFWCAVLPLAESATLNLLGSRVGTYGRIRLWGSVGFVAVSSPAAIHSITSESTRSRPWC